MTLHEDETLVAALYRFTALPEYASLQSPLRSAMQQAGIRGSLLLAREGINGTISGRPVALRQFISDLQSMVVGTRTPLADLDVKWSICSAPPFRKAKVRLKREIVTMGVDDVDPTCVVGTYVDAHDWNAIVDDPDITLIDTRNDYEVAIGTFEGAVSPGTQSFREFPDFVDDELANHRSSAIAMFCTGGIRCEKSTAYLKQRGYHTVYHLRGGILKYLELIPQSQSRWRGECFVFDHRVSVGHGLTVGTHLLCHGCGWPIAYAMTEHPDYEAGVCCPRCIETITADQRHRRRTRQSQMEAKKAATDEFCANC
ncbi:MAG: rhodanese-related sulfurtransferase [Planctomycetota bacterium]